MPFKVEPPGDGWRALRSPRGNWSPEQLHLIRTSVREHPGLPVPVRTCVAGWLGMSGAPGWRAALEALPSPAPTDPVGRFACGRVLLHFAPLARRGNEEAAAAIDRYLTTVPYGLPGMLWLRVEQELYLERLGSYAHDSARDAMQILSTRLLERALDTYKPGPQRDPERWVGEILKNIKIDGQRKSNTEAKIFEPMSPEEVPEELYDQHGSVEDELLCAEVHEVIAQMGSDTGAQRSREMTGRLTRALATLSDNMLAVLYLSLFPPKDRDAGIAALLDTSVSNIRKRRHDALKALRAALASAAASH
jgi:DNA-directed RNA polymerase specialized sigma24 family protein